MSDDVIVDEGPIHKNTYNPTTGVRIFTDGDAEKCPKSLDGLHEWGEMVQHANGGTSYCIHCGLDFEVFAMRCLP